MFFPFFGGGFFLSMYFVHSSNGYDNMCGDWGV